MKLRNKFYIMRHGQALSNVRAMCSCWPEKFHNPLTKQGREVVKESVEKLQKSGKGIDMIFCSPILRTVQTAEIVGKILKVKPKADKRLREIGFGKFNGVKLESMWKAFKKESDRINKGADGGENYKQILARMEGFLKGTDKKFKNKNILIISHEGPLVLLQAKIMGLSLKETTQIPFEKRIHKGEIRELNQYAI
jgi:broad specificity phosphatase PhoE